MLHKMEYAAQKNRASEVYFLTLKGPGGGHYYAPLNKSNALDLWLGPHLQNLYDYSN